MPLFLHIVFLIIVLIDGFHQTFSHRPMENPSLFEGDITGFNAFDRTAISIDSRRWTGAEIFYQFDSSIGNFAASSIIKAMNEYMEHTCIRFKKRIDEPNFVQIYAGDGCFSALGMIGGMQNLSLGAGCIYHGTILHELGHVIGFFHEHSRSDRDYHITVHESNIKEGHQDQFQKVSYPYIRLLTGFDVESVMMYGGFTFSKDDYSETMTSKYGMTLMEVFQKTKLSYDDILRVNKFYRC